MNKLITILFLILFCSISAIAETLKDDIVEENLKNKTLEKPKTNTNYNYQSLKRIPIKLRIIEDISTKKDGIYEGQRVFFRVIENVKYKNKTIIKEGEIFNARIAVYTTKGMNGIPASIIVDDFSLYGIDKNKMTTSYTKYGRNFAAFVLPLKWALTPLPPLGSFTNFIFGTNAKITTKDTIKLYYYPEWDKR